MKLTCDCCGHAQEFADAEEAFQAGWDAPPHFTGYVACDLCPASYIVLGQLDRHVPVHLDWAVNGRPDEFSQDTCLIEADRVPPEALQAVKDAIAQLKQHQPPKD